MPKSARIFADFFYIGRLESTLPALGWRYARLIDMTNIRIYINIR